jgi:hypothetical protein
MSFTGWAEPTTMKRVCVVRRFLWGVGGMVVFLLLIFSIPSCVENATESPTSELRAPVGLTVVFLNATTVEVGWIDPNDYSTINRRDVRYEVQISTDSLLFRRISTTASDSTRTIITYGFAEDSTYYFRVRILAPDVASAFSLVRSLTPIPRARIHLTVTAVCETTVTLNWSTTDSSTVKTIVERRAGTEGTFKGVDSVDALALSLVVGGPYHNDTTYFFRVQTISDLQVHSYSDTAVAVLGFGEPYSLQVHFLADTAASLTWKLDNPYAHTIEVEYLRMTGGYAWVVLGSVGASQSTCVFPQRFIAGWTYPFRARAFSNYNRSSYSGQSSASLYFESPSQLRVTALAPDSIGFAWVDRTGFESSFELLESISGGTFTSAGTYPPNTTTAALSFARDTIQTYQYRVRARSTWNMSAVSNAVLVRYDSVLGAWTWDSTP